MGWLPMCAPVWLRRKYGVLARVSACERGGRGGGVVVGWMGGCGGRGWDEMEEAARGGGVLGGYAWVRVGGEARFAGFVGLEGAVGGPASRQWGRRRTAVAQRTQSLRAVWKSGARLGSLRKSMRVGRGRTFRSESEQTEEWDIPWFADQR